jgi:hypothetical protein
LEIAFDTKKLRDVCQNTDLAADCFGEAISRELRGRLADITAASNVFDIVAVDINIVMLKKQEFALISIGENARLYLSANHNINPRTEDNKINWEKVTRLKVVKIETNHD